MAAKDSKKDSDIEDKFDFESALQQLEQLVEDLEDGDLSLEDALKSFEKGISLTRECQKALKEAEQKVQLLVGEDGETEPFEDLDTDQA